MVDITSSIPILQCGPFEGLRHFNGPRSTCVVGRSYRCPARDESQCAVTSGDLVLPSRTNNAKLGTNDKKVMLILPFIKEYVEIDFHLSGYNSHNDVENSKTTSATLSLSLSLSR